jgi:tRNA dimethylallyltransferase
MDNDHQARETARPYLIVITGPTGVGKTRVCTDLASRFRAPVISADSRQMYREMKIGTAVPEQAQLEKVKHYFIGNLSVHDYYNASMFEMESLALLETLFKKVNPVFMAGGSGLYIDAVCKGIDDLPAVDFGLRNELAEKYHSNGIAWLRQKLKQLDAEYYKIVDLKNPKRMLKAVEICLITGKPYSSFLLRKKKKRNFGIVKIGLNLDRKELYERINRRVDEMIRQGLIDEAAGLYPLRHLNALNTVGYRELFDYIEGKTSMEKAIELIKRNSRRYAKRQLTWLARDGETKWFHPGDQQGIWAFIEDRTGIIAENNNPAYK